MDEATRAEWNRAVESNDYAAMERIAAQALAGIHERQLADWDVHERTR